MKIKILFFSIFAILMVGCGSGNKKGLNGGYSCGWESGYLVNGCWEDSNELKDYSIQVVSDNVRKGMKAMRFEVRPGDDPLGCVGCGERAEVLNMITKNGDVINETKKSGTKYYAFSVMFDKNWENPKSDYDGLWSHFFQLHGPDILDGSAAIAMDTTNSTGGEGISILISTGDLDDEDNVFSSMVFDLKESGLNKGEWVDFVIKINFSVENGRIEVWRRNDNETNFKVVMNTINKYPNGIPTLQYRASYKKGAIEDHYWKHGIYRPHQDITTGPTSILWLDGISRGENFSWVKRNAFP